MAGGDLRARVVVRTHDEIGHVGNGFNAMAESFSALIAKVAGAAGNTRSAASELTDQVAQVTAASARQSESAARSSSSVQALAVSVQQVATHAEDTSRIARQAAELSVDGRAVADQAAAGMQCIVDDIAAAVAAVLALEELAGGCPTLLPRCGSIARKDLYLLRGTSCFRNPTFLSCSTLSSRLMRSNTNSSRLPTSAGRRCWATRR
ncbi:methyl-accepting chemotaxis protein [Aromatoleum anaerobium]|nr:methyl-accepting chemotaxis protein [Aromatoleum anaerobium]